jgi:hypothetical protein
MAQNGVFWRHKICETVKLCFERALRTWNLRWISHRFTVFFAPIVYRAMHRDAQPDAGVVVCAAADCDRDVFMGRVSWLKGRGSFHCAECGSNSSQALIRWAGVVFGILLGKP